MTSTDPLADMVVTRDGAIELLRAQIKEQAAEIERLRVRVAELSAFIAAMPTDDATELRLQDALARIAELEAIVTVGHGTMGTLEPDKPTTITHGHTPNAPPHDE